MTPAFRSAGDDILRWVSENETGRWTNLSEAIAACFRSGDGRSLRAWIIASQLADLGHLDIDWEDGRWSVAPPCLVVSPGMGLCAYLAGWRTAAVVDRFWAAADDLDLFPFQVQQRAAPTAVFVKSGSIDALESLAQRMDVSTVYNPAAHLAELVRLDDGERRLGAPPPPDETLTLFDASSLTWEHVDEPAEAGLYSFELHGRKAFRLFDEGDWYIVDRAEGQLRGLGGRDDVIRWHPPTADGKSPRAMSVASEVSLPALATRAAVAASGLLPMRRIGMRVFPNIPRAAASAIAERLGLVLGFTTTHIAMEA